MPATARIRCFGFFAFLLLPSGLLAQAQATTVPRVGVETAPASRSIVLDVVVTPKSGSPVAGLTQKDFTVLDNNVGQSLTSFRALGGKSAPIETILLVDAVNTGFESVAFERDQIDRFLRENGGRLAQPTTLAVLTDTGVTMQPQFSTDGNALSASLEKYTVGLRTIRRSSGYYGAEERLQISLKAVEQLTAFEATRPGRKVILWVSPGWPLLSGPNTQLDGKQETQIFNDAVSLSNALRRSRTTLYSIDPLGTADAGSFRVFYYKEFLKGLSKPGDAQLGNLGLQVMAVQSGGLALNSSNDVAVLLRQCVADTQAYYELTYDPPPAERVNEYHTIDVKLAEPGMTARTRQGYYSQP